MKTNTKHKKYDKMKMREKRIYILYKNIKYKDVLKCHFLALHKYDVALDK